MNIYELSSSIRQLQELLETEEDTAVIEEALKGYDAKLEDKADSYARVDKNLASLEEGLKAEYDRLKRRSDVIKANRKRLKESLQEAMILANKKKFKTELFSFGIQKNPASLEITGEVPSKYLIEQEPKVDNNAIKNELKKGVELGFARLVQGESLRIR